MPPGGRKTPEEVKGGASNMLRNEMAGMEVGGHEKDRWEVVEAEQDDAEAEGGRVGGGSVGTRIYRAPDSG